MSIHPLEKYFENLIQLMDTNGKLVVWGPVVPLSMKGLLLRGICRLPKQPSQTTKPNHTSNGRILFVPPKKTKTLEDLEVNSRTITWNPKLPFLNGCFSWMIPNRHFHPLKHGCLGVPSINKRNPPIFVGWWKRFPIQIPKKSKGDKQKHGETHSRKIARNRQTPKRNTPEPRRNWHSRRRGHWNGRGSPSYISPRGRRVDKARRFGRWCAKRFQSETQSFWGVGRCWIFTRLFRGQWTEKAISAIRGFRKNMPAVLMCFFGRNS